MQHASWKLSPGAFAAWMANYAQLLKLKPVRAEAFKEDWQLQT